jgi:hypothetical protein
LTSYWIEFSPWPSSVAATRIPPFPGEAGVTAADEHDALDLIRRGFYDAGRELPPVLRIRPGVTVARRDTSGAADLREEASGRRGIWYPKPYFADRTRGASADAVLERILFGPYRGNDEGEGVVTVYLPDRDGTTRSHAY